MNSFMVYIHVYSAVFYVWSKYTCIQLVYMDHLKSKRIDLNFSMYLSKQYFAYDVFNDADPKVGSLQRKFTKYFCI